MIGGGDMKNKIYTVTFSREDSGTLFAVVVMPGDRIGEFIAMAARRGDRLTVSAAREY